MNQVITENLVTKRKESSTYHGFPILTVPLGYQTDELSLYESTPVVNKEETIEYYHSAMLMN